MTAEAPGPDHDAVASRLNALDDMATAEHLAVYTAIAGDLAARLDQPDDQPRHSPKPAPTGNADDGGARG